MSEIRSRYYAPDAPESADHPWEEGYVDDDLLIGVAATQDDFHIGQKYEGVAAKQLECKKCGGNNFHVGSGDYYTAIRCATCRWELCIHEG